MIAPTDPHENSPERLCLRCSTCPSLDQKSTRAMRYNSPRFRWSWIPLLAWRSVARSPPRQYGVAGEWYAANEASGGWVYARRYAGIELMWSCRKLLLSPLKILTVRCVRVGTTMGAESSPVLRWFSNPSTKKAPWLIDGRTHRILQNLYGGRSLSSI